MSFGQSISELVESKVVYQAKQHDCDSKSEYRGNKFRSGWINNIITRGDVCFDLKLLLRPAHGGGLSYWFETALLSRARHPVLGMSPANGNVQDEELREACIL